MDFPDQGSPIVRQTLWQEEPDATDLPTLTLEQTTRMKARVDTIALYAQRVKGECPIAGWVEGAVASYCVLRGIGEAMMDFASRESFLHEILDKITKQAIVYIKAQVKGGADIIGVGDAACSLLGPELYQEYGFVYEKRLIDGIHAEGALAKLHICVSSSKNTPERLACPSIICLPLFLPSADNSHHSIHFSPIFRRTGKMQ